MSHLTTLLTRQDGSIKKDKDLVRIEKCFSCVFCLSLTAKALNRICQ